jgi:hypothetical protein
MAPPRRTIWRTIRPVGRGASSLVVMVILRRR